MSYGSTGSQNILDLTKDFKILQRPWKIRPSHWSETRVAEP